MMIFMHFTFQTLLLSIGFGVGYWLLITAASQEFILKIIGRSLGGLLIVMTIFFAIFSCYYSTKFSIPQYTPLVETEDRQLIDSEENRINAEKATMQKLQNSFVENKNNSNEKSSPSQSNSLNLNKDREEIGR